MNNKHSEAIFFNNPIRWHGVYMGIKINTEVLKDCRIWLNMSPLEQFMNRDKYYEFTLMGDEGIEQMQTELLSVLN